MCLLLWHSYLILFELTAGQDFQRWDKKPTWTSRLLQFFLFKFPSGPHILTNTSRRINSYTGNDILSY